MKDRTGSLLKVLKNEEDSLRFKTFTGEMQRRNDAYLRMVDDNDDSPDSDNMKSVTKLLEAVGMNVANSLVDFSGPHNPKYTERDEDSNIGKRNEANMKAFSQKLSLTEVEPMSFEAYKERTLAAIENKLEEQMYENEMTYKRQFLDFKAKHGEPSSKKTEGTKFDSTEEKFMDGLEPMLEEMTSFKPRPYLPSRDPFEMCSQLVEKKIDEAKEENSKEDKIKVIYADDGDDFVRSLEPGLQRLAILEPPPYFTPDQFRIWDGCNNVMFSRKIY